MQIYNGRKWKPTIRIKPNNKLNFLYDAMACIAQHQRKRQEHALKELNARIKRAEYILQYAESRQKSIKPKISETEE